MPSITYVEHDGTEHTVDVDEEMSLMEGATLNMVPGIEGMCGGICSCATCHCYLSEADLAALPAATPGELDMLGHATHRKANSRLGCQIAVTAEMEGLRVDLPPDQG